MSASEEFKAQLKAGKIMDALALALGEATELEITTWVSSPEDNESLHSSGADNRLRTRINLIEGEIENEVGRQFLESDRYAKLQKFHLEQVKEGHSVLQRNLESLQQMFIVLTGTLSQLPQNPSLRSDSEDS